MPKLSGLFDSFDNLDQIDIGSLISWLKNPPSPTILENYLANKILYPQTLPLTEADLKIDLAILRVALRINGPRVNDKGGNLLGDNPFLNIALRKIIIPEKFLNFAPDLISLTWAFVDGLLLGRVKKDIFEDLWTLVLADDIDEVLGSLILPRFSSGRDSMDLSLMDEQSSSSNKSFKIKPGSLTVIPCPKDRCDISYKLAEGEVLGKKEAVLEVYGGSLGLIIDGRSK